MRSFDLSSWQTILSSVLSLALFALIGVGIRVLLTMTIQQRRERANRQINERLKTLMAAYKALGGSFTGNLTVDPTHLRDLRRRAAPPPLDGGLTVEPDIRAGTAAAAFTGPTPRVETAPEFREGMMGDAEEPRSDRSWRIRDTVEAALSDILLLGTEEQVRLAAKAVAEMVEGRPIHTAELVISLRDFIRKALDLDPIPPDVKVPLQGPARPQGAGGGRAARGDNSGDSRRSGGGGGGGNGGGGAAAAGGGASIGMGMGMGIRAGKDDDEHREAAS